MSSAGQVPPPARVGSKPSSHSVALLLDWARHAAQAQATLT